MFEISMTDFMACLALAYALSPIIDGVRVGYARPPRTHLEAELDFIDSRSAIHPGDPPGDILSEGGYTPQDYHLDPVGADAGLMPYVMSYLMALGGDQWQTPRPTDRGPTCGLTHHTTCQPSEGSAT